MHDALFMRGLERLASWCATANASSNGIGPPAIQSANVRVIQRSHRTRLPLERFGGVKAASREYEGEN